MWVCVSLKTEWSLSRVQMTPPFVTLRWGSDKNPALSTKDAGREMLQGRLPEPAWAPGRQLRAFCALGAEPQSRISLHFLAVRAANIDHYGFARMEANSVAKH